MVHANNTVTFNLPFASPTEVYVLENWMELDSNGTPGKMPVKKRRDVNIYKHRTTIRRIFIPVRDRWGFDKRSIEYVSDARRQEYV